MLRNNFYVYVHRKTSNNSIFYVGKGCDYRAYDKTGRNDYWEKTYNKHGLIVEIVLNNLTEQQAFNLEIELIAFYGRENLCNLTDGGEGSSGVIFSQSRLLKIKQASINQWSSTENRQAQSVRIKNAFLTNEDYRKKHSESQKRIHSTNESKLETSIRMKNYYSNPENKIAHQLRQNALANNIEFIEKQRKNKLELFNNAEYREKNRINRLNAVNVRKIICTNTGDIFNCMNDAAKKFDIRQGNISHVLNGNRKSVGGYKFTYYKETP